MSCTAPADGNIDKDAPPLIANKANISDQEIFEVIVFNGAAYFYSRVHQRYITIPENRTSVLVATSSLMDATGFQIYYGDEHYYLRSINDKMHISLLSNYSFKAYAIAYYRRSDTERFTIEKI